MLDDLDLAWEEQQDARRGRGGSRSRQARRSRRKDRKRRRRSFGALFISVVMLAALGGGVYWGVGKAQEFFGAPDYAGNPQQVAVSVTIERGDTITDIANKLYEKDIVQSAKAFVNAADAEPRSKNIQPGTYNLFARTKASAVLAMLLDPKQAYMNVTEVTIREGLSAIQTFKVLSEKTGIPAADFVAAAKDPIKLGVPDYWFTRSLDDKEAVVSVEGFLFPDTYRFSPEATATQILEKMINQFLTVVGDLKLAESVQKSLGISPYEVLIVASLAQVEAGKEEDFGKVARVAYNRAIKFKDTFPCGCLQFDVTANYFLEQQGKATKASKDLTSAELDNPRNPWNTGPSTPGLPAGPISNPGAQALKGAMNPPSANWLYFVAVDKQGTTKFADTYVEHQKNEALARKNGVL